MAPVIDHSGMGAARLRSHPDIPIAHKLGEPCWFCDGPAQAATGHKPGDPHRYDLVCKDCGERGTIRLTIDPEEGQS